MTQLYHWVIGFLREALPHVLQAFVWHGRLWEGKTHRTYITCRPCHHILQAWASIKNGCPIGVGEAACDSIQLIIPYYSSSFLQRFPVFIIILFLRFIRLILGVKHKLLCVFPSFANKGLSFAGLPFGHHIFHSLLVGIRPTRATLISRSLAIQLGKMRVTIG